MLFSLLIFAHGAFGIWDEIIGFAMAVLFITVFVGAWIYSRRFEPELEEDDPVAEPAPHSKNRRPKPK